MVGWSQNKLQTVALMILNINSHQNYFQCVENFFRHQEVMPHEGRFLENGMWAHQMALKKSF